MTFGEWAARCADLARGQLLLPPGPERSYKEWVGEATRHERAARWSEAGRAWAAAAAALKRERAAEPPEKVDAREAEAARSERARARQSGLKPGDVVRHVKRWTGEVLASCEYAGDRDWRYAGASYKSPTAAAAAAARDLGYATPGAQSGWIFWGIEKRADVKGERKSRGGAEGGESEEEE